MHDMDEYSYPTEMLDKITYINRNIEAHLPVMEALWCLSLGYKVTW